MMMTTSNNWTENFWLSLVERCEWLRSSVLLSNSVENSDSKNMRDDLFSISVALSLFALCQTSPLISAVLRLAAWGCLKPVCQTKGVLWLQQRASLHKENKTKRTRAQWVGKEWVVFRRRKKALLWMFPCRAENENVFLFTPQNMFGNKRISSVFTWNKRQTISPARHSTKSSLVWHLYRVMLLFKGITY